MIVTKATRVCDTSERDHTPGRRATARKIKPEVINLSSNRKTKEGTGLVVVCCIAWWVLFVDTIIDHVILFMHVATNNFKIFQVCNFVISVVEFEKTKYPVDEVGNYELKVGKFTVWTKCKILEIFVISMNVITVAFFSLSIFKKEEGGVETAKNCIFAGELRWSFLERLDDKRTSMFSAIRRRSRRSWQNVDNVAGSTRWESNILVRTISWHNC